jgi:hypothetical protein
MQKFKYFSQVTLKIEGTFELDDSEEVDDEYLKAIAEEQSFHQVQLGNFDVFDEEYEVYPDKEKKKGKK